MTFYAVIPAGGSGTRLWPLSRAARPKFLLDVDGSGRSLLQHTWDRLDGIADHIAVVTGSAHTEAVREQLPELPPEMLFTEPEPRNSMPAIAWATAAIAQNDNDAIIGSFAADHHICDEAAFHAVINQALAVAESNFLCTIGMAVREPSTAFGYIELGDALDVPRAPDARHVQRFVEKPDAATAHTMATDSRYVWNAGMFVARASMLVEHLSALHPDLYAAIERFRQSHSATHWSAVSAISIDHALAEPLATQGLVATVPGEFGWNDIGDFAALANIAPHTAESVVLGGDAFVMSQTGKPVTVIGIDGAVVIETPDAILVTTRAHAQHVGQAPAKWRDRGRSDLA